MKPARKKPCGLLHFSSASYRETPPPPSQPGTPAILFPNLSHSAPFASLLSRQTDTVRGLFFCFLLLFHSEFHDRRSSSGKFDFWKYLLLCSHHREILFLLRAVFSSSSRIHLSVGEGGLHRCRLAAQPRFTSPLNSFFSPLPGRSHPNLRKLAFMD